MSKNKYWEKIGSVGVDAGLLWLGDPCYILHVKADEIPKELGKTWNEFCDNLYGDSINQTKHQFNYDLGHPGLGVCVPTGYGDGEYSVYVQKNKEGRVMKVLVDFDQDMNEEEENEI